MSPPAGAVHWSVLLQSHPTSLVDGSDRIAAEDAIQVTVLMFETDLHTNFTFGDPVPLTPREATST